jgi:ribulose-phosphate 3-epimerase
MNTLSPSILAADFWRLGEQIQEVEKAGVKCLHIDVMDGIFVKSISYGMPVLASIRKRTKMFFDVHLMIIEPERYIEQFIRDGADSVTFHLEATHNVQKCIDMIREKGVKVAISIKPGTPVSALEPYLDQLDMVLVMTVEPGFGGQKYLPECTEKVRQVRKLIEERNLQCAVQVDGGIIKDNLSEVLESGANVVVAGSAIFKDDIQANVKTFMDIMNA